MIAKVRIAPIDKWCDIQKAVLTSNPNRTKLVGVEVEIDTATMVQESRGKSWELSRESYIKMFEITGEGNPQRYRTGTICEHLLEMD